MATWLASATVTRSVVPVLPSVTAAGSVTVIVGASLAPLIVMVMYCVLLSAVPSDTFTK